MSEKENFVDLLHKEMYELQIENLKNNIKERDKICLEMCADYNKQIIELKLQIEQQKKTAIIELQKLMKYINENVEIENDISALKLQDFYNNQIKSLME